MEQANKAPAFRSITPATADEWLAIKPMFLRLYIEEDKTLDQVRQTLASQYGFDATVKAYKRRITQWGARKNYNAAEKESLSQHQLLSLINDDKGVELTIRGRPVKWDRVRRYNRAKRRKQVATSTSTPQTQDISHQNPQTGLQIMIRPSLPDNDEMILRSARDCFVWICNPRFCDTDSYITSHLEEILGKIYQATEVVDSAQRPLLLRRSWRIIKDSCETLSQTLKSASEPEMLNLLIRSIPYSEPGSRSRGAQNQIFEYLWNLCSIYCVSSTPLKHMLRTFQQPETMFRCIPRLAQVYIDHFDSGANNGCVRQSHLLFSFVIGLCNTDYSDTALRLIAKSIESKKINTPMKYQMIYFQALMASSLQNFRFAIQQLKGVLRYATKMQDVHSVVCLNLRIAEIHLRLKNQGQANQHLSQAVEIFVERSTLAEDAFASIERMGVADNLCLVLDNMGRHDEAQALSERFLEVREDEDEEVSQYDTAYAMETSEAQIDEHIPQPHYTETYNYDNANQFDATMEEVPGEMFATIDQLEMEA